MSSAQIVFEGLDELKAELRNLPMALALDAGGIVEGVAEAAGDTIRSDYPTGKTGNLKRGVTVQRGTTSRTGAVAVVRSSAPHAWIFEHGTKARFTKKGAGRGAMPEAPSGEQMIPVAIRARRGMYLALAELLRAHGAEVSGSD